MIHFFSTVPGARSPSSGEVSMAFDDVSPIGLNLAHPEIMRSVLSQILATGDVVGRDGSGRTILAVAVDDWLFDALAAFESDLEDFEPEALEGDEPD
jgi:hypothetical protein